IHFNDLDILAASTEKPGQAVERSMLLQLRQEMDRLSPTELVFVTATARAPAHLDPGLFQTGSFELVLEVGLPTAEDRRELLRRLNTHLGLEMTSRALDRAVELTGQEDADEPGCRDDQ